MSVLCKDLYSLSSLKEIKLVAGKGGLTRKISWAYIGENANVGEWGKGGEIMFITGIGMDRSKEGLLHLVEESNRCNLAGIVISVNDMYIGEIPKEVADRADELDFPVFTIPWHVKRIEVSKEIALLLLNAQQTENTARNLLKYLKTKRLNEEEKKDMRHIINSYSVSNHNKYTAIVFEIVLEMGVDEKSYMEKIKQEIMDGFFRNKLIVIDDKCKIYCLVYGSGKEEKTVTVKKISKLIEKVLEKQLAKKVYVGICVDDREENESITSAVYTCKIAKKIGNRTKVLVYDELGIYRVIYRDTRNSEHMEYCRQILQKLIEYDNNNEGYMIDTAIAYFENMYNISKTADALYIHRNSLMYRLNKMEELTGKNLKNAYEMTDIAYCAIAYKLFQ